MSIKSTDTFFTDEKKPWSKVKDELLYCYLVPYTQKIFTTGRTLIYIDCFAGSGAFGGLKEIPAFTINDQNFPENAGSPIIALKALEMAKLNSKGDPKYRMHLVEKKYGNNLIEIIQKSQFKSLYKQNHITIYQDDFKEVVPGIVKKETANKKCNLFCYVDPFGIKDLKMKVFQSLFRNNLYSIELLINFNSFGFFRYACAYKKALIKERKILEISNEGYERIESETQDIKTNRDKKTFLDEILGCDKWEEIIDDFHSEKIDCYEAERRISKLYKEQLKSVLNFKYVLDIPISVEEKKIPKYRMIYATKHPDGAVIMGDVMVKRKELIHDLIIEKNQQKTLFDEKDYENKDIIKKNLYSLITNQEQRIADLTAKFYDKFGIIHTKINNILKDLEKENYIKIRRYPELTATGRVATFLEEKSIRKVFISLI